MSAVRFDNSGNLIVASGISKVNVTMTFKWNDNAYEGDTALAKITIPADDKTESMERTLLDSSGEKSRSFVLSANQNSSKTYSITYQKYINVGTEDGAVLVSASPASKDSDTKLSFRDNDGTDTNATVRISVGTPEYFTVTPPPPPVTDPEVPTPVDTVTVNGPSSCPSPTPWENILPTCGVAPRGTSTTGGLQISKASNNSIALNLRNYEGKLVTLKVTQQTSADWTHSFSFNIPNCSDISPGTGGTPYARGGYSNTNIKGTNTFFIYNLDGGDYNYIFVHDSTPGPRPTRTVYDLKSYTTTSVNETGGTDTVITYYCDPRTETWSGAWPYCATGVAVSKNGGDKVQWQYEDGGGGNYNDQYVTVEVISTRSAIPDTGAICTSSLKSSVWLQDGANSLAKGNCISDYRNHSAKIRFRIPSLRSSKTTLNDPVCYSNFRGVAGAISPGTEEGTFSPEYSVLHIFDPDFQTTSSLVPDSSIQVEVINPSNSDAHVDPSNPINTALRKHYRVNFLDNTQVLADANNVVTNISVAPSLNLTAEGIDATLTSYAEKVPGTTSSMYVWFAINTSANQEITDDIRHSIVDGVFNPEFSDLDTANVTVTVQAEDDPGLGNGEPYDVLNTVDKKHYLITFTDSTIVNADASNINITINARQTADSITTNVGVSKKEKVTDKQVRVWFTAYYSDRLPGEDIDNAYLKDWSINRVRVQSLSGNFYARSWSLVKNV